MADVGEWRGEGPSSFGKASRWLFALTAMTALLPIGPHEARAATGDKSGKEVVETVCSSCHATGANGAPKIGDQQAWSKRASQGLTSLTEHALQGIRQMPAHGGSPGLTDQEVKRAITYMVNASGGHWQEPIDKTSPPRERTGEQIVRLQCSKCHETGVDGAPKIGDRAAWVPRMKQGLDTAVRSAINGHGGMPARGGMANLTDAEIRAAVLYMFNVGTAAPTPAPVASGQDFKTVDGMTVYLGVVPASVIRAHAKDYPGDVARTAPSGADQRYLTIALFDASNGKRVTDAAVTGRVTGATAASAEKPLKAVTVAGALTYGNYFPMQRGQPLTITVHINRPGASNPAQAQFQYTAE